ncbi:ORF2 [Mal de Rio Cuarto virus]|uniref:ORF2 n=1 Tax=Mal de Rio Cuarto virus TaxID=185954 RepID=A0PJ20_9REOV|nr:ORF2 [Mal de Rio Cuarto virus]AAY27970.1 ORF2 [Mal de Rio Cuarto virus]
MDSERHYEYGSYSNSHGIEFDPNHPYIDLINDDFDENDYLDLETLNLEADYDDVESLALRLKNAPDYTTEIFEKIDRIPNFVYLFETEIIDNWNDYDLFADLRVTDTSDEFYTLSSMLTEHMQSIITLLPSILWPMVSQLTKSNVFQAADDVNITNYWRLMDRRWDFIDEQLRVQFIFRAYDLRAYQNGRVSQILSNSLLFAGLNLIGKRSCIPINSNFSIPDYLDYWFPTDDYHSDNYLIFIKFNETKNSGWKKIVVQYYLRKVFSKIRTGILIAHIDVDFWYNVFMRTLVRKEMIHTKNLIKSVLNF